MAEQRPDSGRSSALESHHDAADLQNEPSQSQKEVIHFTSQKEIVFDPDTMPQAVYPRGIPGLHGFYKPQPQLPPEVHHAQHQQPPFYPYADQPYPVQQYTGPTSTSYSGSSYSPSQHYADGALVKPAPIVPNEKAPSSHKGRRICGLAPRTFNIVAAVLAVIIVAAVVGGAVGGTLAKRASEGDDTDDSGGWEPGDNTTDSDLLYSSRLAAVNWTDENDHSHYAVFSQDYTLSIVVSLWDTENLTWTAVNVSEALENAGTPISVREGSPLAAASTGPPNYDFEMHMYFFAETSDIGEIYTNDPAGKDWRIGNLTGMTLNHTAAETSDLAAVWHRCEVGCAGYIYVAYEDENQVINLLNSSDWSRIDTEIVPDYQVDPSSGLALIPFITDSGKESLNPGELRLYWDGSADLNEFKFNASGEWEGGLQLAMGISTSPQPQFAASPFDDYVQTLVISRQPEGTLTGYHWDNVTWDTQDNITMSDGPDSANFSSIAMNMARRFYGVMDGQIEEYTWNASDPFTFVYVGPVDITVNTTSNSTDT